jgi:hypothetical protein
MADRRVGGEVFWYLVSLVIQNKAKKDWEMEKSWKICTHYRKSSGYARDNVDVTKGEGRFKSSQSVE